MHNCPVCGEKTEGSYSEGGIHFRICERCYFGWIFDPNKEKKRKEKEKKERDWVIKTFADGLGITPEEFLKKVNKNKD